MVGSSLFLIHPLELGYAKHLKVDGKDWTPNLLELEPGEAWRSQTRGIEFNYLLRDWFMAGSEVYARLDD
jgi:hypothetical protein